MCIDYANVIGTWTSQRAEVQDFRCKWKAVYFAEIAVAVRNYESYCIVDIGELQIETRQKNFPKK